VLQRPDGSGEQASGMVAQWLLEERDPDDRPVCEFMWDELRLWID